MLTVSDHRQDTFPTCANKKKQGYWKPKPGVGVEMQSRKSRASFIGGAEKAPSPERFERFFAKEQVLAAICLYEPLSNQNETSPAHEFSQNKFGSIDSI